MLRATLLQLAGPPSLPPPSLLFRCLSPCALLCVLLCNVAHSCMLQSSADALAGDEDAACSAPVYLCVCVSVCSHACA